MKKTFLFLVIFFLFLTLSASEMAEKNGENQKKHAQNCSCGISNENETKPKIFYFAPAIGIKTGMPAYFSAVADMDLDFLVYHAKKGHNLYLGLDLGLRYTPYSDEYGYSERREHIVGFPLQVNIVFDSKRHNPHVDYLSFWISGGADLMCWQETNWIWENHVDVKIRKSFFEVTAAWGIGLDLIFKNNMVLKFGFDSFHGIYPELMIALGYRF